MNKYNFNNIMTFNWKKYIAMYYRKQSLLFFLVVFFTSNIVVIVTVMRKWYFYLFWDLPTQWSRYKFCTIWPMFDLCTCVRSNPWGSTVRGWAHSLSHSSSFYQQNGNQEFKLYILMINVLTYITKVEITIYKYMCWTAT